MQIPNNSKERVIDAINVTKYYLNHEFWNYILKVKEIEPTEWKWVINSYKTIFGERPNLPIGIYSRLEFLYTSIFELEANKFMELCRELSEVNKALKEGSARKVELQYNKWRSDFTSEANEIIRELELDQQGLKASLIDELKNMVARGAINDVISRMIEFHNHSFEKQKLLYGLSFRNKNLNKEKIRGTISNEEAQLEQNRIVESMLKMIDELN